MRLITTRPDWSRAPSAIGTVYRLDGPGGAAAEVTEADGGFVLRQDLVRSFPLFYATDPHGDGFVVSDDVRALVGETGVHGVDAEAAAEFRQLGYVTGAATLHPGIRQVQAGERVELHADGSVASHLVRTLGTDSTSTDGDQEADLRFGAALEEVFARLVERLDGRQIVVPLSGGLDSRLIAVLLRDLGYDNVLNFTYGVGDTPEARISRTVAEAVGQPWTFVPYDAAEIRQAWSSGDAAPFLRDAYAGASLPHIQDWFALRHLRGEGLIAEDAVFLPGHTVVGNMHDDQILDVPGDVPAEAIRELILHHHAVLQPHGAAALRRSAAFVTRIDDHLRAHGYDGSPAARLIALESWNMRERQAKYINNSMRAYEHFGHDWALPMLDEPVIRAWEGLSVRLRRDRDWYAGFVSRRYTETTGTELSTYSPTSLSGGTRARIKSVLRATGLLSFAERAAAARSFANHAMAFQAFVEEGAERDLTRIIMRGGHPFGIYADRFLADAWAPGQELFG